MARNREKSEEDFPFSSCEKPASLMFHDLRDLGCGSSHRNAPSHQSKQQ